MKGARGILRWFGRRPGDDAQPGLDPAEVGTAFGMELSLADEQPQPPVTSERPTPPTTRTPRPRRSRR